MKALLSSIKAVPVELGSTMKLRSAMEIGSTMRWRTGQDGTAVWDGNMGRRRGTAMKMNPEQIGDEDEDEDPEQIGEAKSR